MIDAENGKNKEQKPVNRKLLIATLCVCVMVGFAYIPDLMSSDEVENAEVAITSSDDAAQDSTSERDSTVPAPGSVRVATPAQQKALMLMVSPPVYHDMYAAAQIIKQAQDQAEAKDFVLMRTTVRNLRLAEEASRLAATDAENRLKKQKSELQLLALDNKGSSSGLGLEPAPGERLAGSAAIAGAPVMPGNIGGNGGQLSDASSRDSEFKDYSLRVAGFSRTGRLTLQNGLEFVPNARVGQTVFGKYKIESINSELRCVEIRDAISKKTMPTICYAG
ncbi:hypothetical protein D3C80_370660 [compost metagenome]